MPTRDLNAPVAFDRPDASRGRPDTFDVRQLWATLRHRYKFVFGVALTVFAAVMLATLVSRMKFRSVSRLYLGELEESSVKSGARSKEEIDLSAGGQGVVGSEMEIIQSRTLVAKAISDSGLNVSINVVGKKVPRYGQWLLARRDPTALDMAVQSLRAKDARLTDASAREQSFTVVFRSDTEYEASREDGRSAKGKLGERAELPGASLVLRAGDGRAPKAGEQYFVVVRPLMVVIDEALSALQVTAPRATPQSPQVNVVTLEFSDGSPRLAASFLDRLIAAYLAERQEWKVEEASAAESFVSSQLETVRSALDDIQQKLADYRTKNRVVVMDNEAKAMIEQIGKYEEQRVAAHLEVAALSEVQRTLKKPNPPVGAFMLGEAKDTVLDDMATALTTARQKLTDLESRFNDGAPELRDQRQQVEAQLEAIRNYVASRAARAKESLGTLDGVIGGFEARLKSVPGAELRLIQLSREQEVYNRTYSYLLERQQQTAIIKASTLSKNRILDAPQVAYREDSPKLLLRLASAPLGLLLGIAVVLLRSLLASTFQSEVDARSFVDGLPVFATVPHRPKRRGERRGVQGAGSFDVLGSDTGSSFTEAFRTLRANLYRAGNPGVGRILLLTSPNEGDGKTTCALALAAALAADGKRVVLVDADLRHTENQPPPPGPRDSAVPGLADVLLGQRAWNESLRPVKVPFGQFYSVAAGHGAAPELLSSPGMLDFLSEIQRHCDYVLLDAPSFPAAADALVLSPHVDGVLSVIRLENTERRAALEHLRGLTMSARSFGVVLNGVGVSTDGPGSVALVQSEPIPKPVSLVSRKRPSTAGAPAPSSPHAS
ncbi:MAG: capsular exopolysaccharide family [Polyangiaceae bacterium]|nr:capsular exopolysaccharide family [Polyangiaceae bacterium]